MSAAVPIEIPVTDIIEMIFTARWERREKKYRRAMKRGRRMLTR